MQGQLFRPSGFVHAGDHFKLLGREVQARPLQLIKVRADAIEVFLPGRGVFNAVNDPLEHAHVFAVAWPHKLSVGALAEPVGRENAGQLGAGSGHFFAQMQPVLEVVAHVVAGKGQHGKGIAAHDALLANDGGGGFRAHGRGHIHALHPVAGMGNQRHGVGAASTKNKRINRHACRVVPCGVQGRVVNGRNCKPRIGVGGLSTGLLGYFRRPVFALPVDGVRRCGAHALPPHVTVVGQGHVGVNDLTLQAGHAIGVGERIGARRHTKVPGFRVDGVHTTVFAGLDPGNVVTNGGDFPAVKTGRRHQHGEVGLAAGAGERRRHVVLFARRVGHAQNQHVLGQPLFVATHVGGNAQGKTLFT